MPVRSGHPGWRSATCCSPWTSSNVATLRRLGRAEDGTRIRLFSEVAGGDGDIPDPYGGSAADFDHVLDLLAAATPVIVERLGRLLDPSPSRGSGGPGPGGPGPGAGR